jgi:adenine-specific DNA-methyltransferase
MKSSEEIILHARILELEAQISELKKQKKYGLIFEKHIEDVVLECETKIPILKEVKNRKIVQSENTMKNSEGNILIEGDNYHSLSVLNYTHKGKIDVIYIDPPYNTGNKDFIYNDRYVDKEDGYRHSKWLSFMEKRLLLAKELMKDSGVIFISIDDNEQAQLKLLCDEVFGEGNFINTLIWQRASGGGNAKGIVTGHDYVLVYQISMPIHDFMGEKIDEKRFSKDKIVEKEGKKFFVNDDIIRKVFGKYESGVERRCFYEDLEQYKNKKQILEINNKIKTGEYFLIKQVNEKHFIARLESAETRKKMYSIIQGVLNNEGANEMEDLGLPFSYPKPTNFIKKIVNSIENSQAVLLDFFAGSGTTGHAVLELNKEDGGNRKFILCTNNGDEKSEHKICEDITYERLRRVMKGYTNKKGEQVDGLGGELHYYKTGFVEGFEKKKASDAAKIRLARTMGEVIAVREGTLVEREHTDTYQIFENKEVCTAIYFLEDKSALSALVESLKKEEKRVVLYIFSWGKNEYKSEYGSDKIRVEDIPEPLLEVYKSINML